MPGFFIFRDTGPELVARFFVDMFIINAFMHLIFSFPGVATHFTFIGYQVEGAIFWPLRWQGEWRPPLGEGGSFNFSHLLSSTWI